MFYCLSQPASYFLLRGAGREGKGKERFSELPQSLDYLGLWEGSYFVGVVSFTTRVSRYFLPDARTNGVLVAIPHLFQETSQ